MWDQLKLLIDLQELDSSIAALQKTCKEIPIQINTLEKEVEKAMTSLHHIKVEAEALTKLRRARERDLEECSQNLKKKQSRLFEVKTNQEYTAVLKEIEVLKEKQSQLEEEVLEIMERGDKMAAERAKAEGELAQQELRFKKEKAALEGELREKEAQLSRLLIKRRDHTTQVESDILYTYNKLLKSRNGLAVIAVRDGSCLGCFVSLTPQAYNEVQKNEKLMSCPNCNRILYYKN